MLPGFNSSHCWGDQIEMSGGGFQRTSWAHITLQTSYQWPVHNEKLHPGIQKRLLAWLALLAFEMCFEEPATHELIHPSDIRPSFKRRPNSNAVRRSVPPLLHACGLPDRTTSAKRSRWTSGRR